MLVRMALEPTIDDMASDPATGSSCATAADVGDSRCRWALRLDSASGTTALPCTALRRGSSPSRD